MDRFFTYSAKNSWVQLLKRDADPDPYNLTDRLQLRSHRLVQLENEFTSTTLLCGDAVSPVGHEFINAVSWLVQNRSADHGNEFEYPCLQVNSNDLAVSEVIQNLHKLAHWVVTINDFIDRRQLINNNVLDMEAFSAPEASQVEKSIYAKYSQARERIIEAIHSELLNEDAAPLETLPEDMFAYMQYIYSFLVSEGIIMTGQISQDADYYQAWRDDTISLRDYLYAGIADSWIDTTKLSIESRYSGADDVYGRIVEYVMADLETDQSFAKRIYRYLINDGTITGRELCLALYSQNILAYDEGEVRMLEQNGEEYAFQFIRQKISDIEITPAQLALDPCSASCVITDVNTGEVLCLVTYPSYDNNKFSGTVDADYYNKLNNDLSLPLFNNATQAQKAPGSTFKPIMAVAALEEGVIGLTDTVDCTGRYTEITPGRPTISEHRYPKDSIFPPIQNQGASLQTKLNVNIITAAEQQTMNYYMNVANLYQVSDIGRRMYQEIGMIEEEHVSQYESLMDPRATWLESLLLHEYTECYLYYSCMMTECDPSIRRIWEDCLTQEISHLHMAKELLWKYEQKEYQQVVGEGTLPEILALRPNIQYVRKVLETTAGNTQKKECVVPIGTLGKDDPFYLYQSKVNLPQDSVPTHEIIDRHIRCCGCDYRYETAPSPIPSLRSRTCDNIALGRIAEQTPAFTSACGTTENACRCNLTAVRD